jgi:hypothetical protein
MRPIDKPQAGVKSVVIRSESIRQPFSDGNLFVPGVNLTETRNSDFQAKCDVGINAGQFDKIMVDFLGRASTFIICDAMLHR